MLLLSLPNDRAYTQLNELCILSYYDFTDVLSLEDVSEQIFKRISSECDILKCRKEMKGY